MNNLFTTGERMFDKFRGYKSGSSFWMDDNYFTRDEFDPQNNPAYHYHLP